MEPKVRLGVGGLARRAYAQHIDDVVAPVCVQNIERPWLRASLDGMTWDGSRIVEIKCGRHVYRETAMFRSVPRQYVGQVQHIMAVTGVAQIDFWCYWPGCVPVLITGERDALYIRRLIAAEELIWARLNDARGQA